MNDPNNSRPDDDLEELLQSLRRAFSRSKPLSYAQLHADLLTKMAALGVATVDGKGGFAFTERVLKVDGEGGIAFTKHGRELAKLLTTLQSGPAGLLRNPRLTQHHR
jgi:hypothetical protein